MRRSEFSELADHVFGPALARAHRRDLILPELGDRSADEALTAGLPVRSVWNALCDAMDVPDAQRWEIPPQERHR